MFKIGGNTVCELKIKSGCEENEIGERISTEILYYTLNGYIDYINGDSKYTIFNTKMQESTHVFICDFVELPLLNDRKVNATDLKAYINGDVYDVTILDNPMELNEQLEIYLKFVGE